MHSPRLSGPHQRSLARRVLTIGFNLLLLAGLAACSVPAGPLSGRATDEWTHHYPLSAGGEVRIANTNGQVDVEAADAPGPGNDVEVRAERIAHATTDAGARDLLPRIAIKEDVKPDAVSIETQKMGGIMFGASFEVSYHVRAPKGAVVHVSTTNGRITLAGLTGSVFAEATNGAITGKGLAGGVDAETTNGPINIDMTSVGPDKIRAQTTNGPVSLIVPDGTKADVHAAATNGFIGVQAANFEASESSRRRVEGRLNGGGTSIELSTTNGPVRLSVRTQRAGAPAPARGPQSRQQ